MKKLIGLSLGMCLLSTCSGLVLAQVVNADGTNPPPKVLVIQREFVKPGKTGMVHDRSESAFVRAMVEAKSQSYYFGMTSLSGQSRALFFVPYDSFEAWEKDNQSIEHNATLAAALDHAAAADGDLLSSYDSSVWTFNPEQSLNRFRENCGDALHGTHHVQGASRASEGVERVGQAVPTRL